jgi:hypothetical protein
MAASPNPTNQPTNPPREGGGSIAVKRVKSEYSYGVPHRTLNGAVINTWVQTHVYRDNSGYLAATEGLYLGLYGGRTGYMCRKSNTSYDDHAVDCVHYGSLSVGVKFKGL